MNNRISTGMMYTQSVSLMLGKQAKLNHLEQQLATGSKIVSAKDDPVAAGTAVGLDRAVASLERLGANANVAQNRLGLQENILAQAGDMMARITELTVQSNNPALSGADLKGVASELKSIKEALLSLGNTTDGTGRYLFGGTDDDTAPFSLVNGTVTYSGDQTQRSVEIAPGTYVSDALPGSEIFMRIVTGDGTVDGSANTGNSGTAILTNVTRDNSGNWNGESYSVVFTAADAYEIRDANNAVISTGAYTAGEDIVFGGLRLTVEGAPIAGDSLNAGPAQNRDIFATVDKLIGALEMDVSTPGARAAQQNLLQAGTRDIARAAETMIDARAAGGAQLTAIDNATALREANAVSLKTTLSGMRDLDYADAISQYQLETSALQAAQTIFSQMQSMSLFNMIR